MSGELNFEQDEKWLLIEKAETYLPKVDSINGQTGVVVLDLDLLASNTFDYYSDLLKNPIYADTFAYVINDEGTDLAGLYYTENGLNWVRDDSIGLKLGETSTTAYRGDRGKTAYNHSQVITGNPHGTTAVDLNLGNVDNTSDANKPISTSTQTALDNTVKRTSESLPVVNIVTTECFLPSLNELQKIHLNLISGLDENNVVFTPLSEFVGLIYYSSTQKDNATFYGVDESGATSELTKDGFYYGIPCKKYNSYLNYQLRDIGENEGRIFYKLSIGGGQYTYYEALTNVKNYIGSSDFNNISGTLSIIGSGTNNTNLIIASQLTGTSMASTIFNLARSINENILIQNNGKIQIVKDKKLTTNDYITADKNKLLGIESGAQVNTLEGIQVNGTTIVPDINKVVNIIATTDLTGQLHLDQTTPQTIINGIPLLQSTRVINNDNQLIDRAYAISLAGGGMKSWFFTKTASDIGGMYKATTILPTGGLQTIVVSAVGSTETTLATFLSEIQTQSHRVVDGARFFYLLAKTNSNQVGEIQLKGYVYITDINGVNPVLVGTTTMSSFLTNVDTTAVFNYYGTSRVVLATERIKFIITSINLANHAHNVTLSLEDNTFSRFDVPSPVGVTDITGKMNLDQTVAQTIINGQPIQDTLTASQLVATDSQKKLQSLAVASYPSLAEVAYLKGVTSEVQNQINSNTTSINNKQEQLNGTGLIRLNGTTITYDNSVYLKNATGISGGTNLIGGTGAGEKLIIDSSSNTSRGGIEFGNNSTGGENVTIHGLLGNDLTPALTGASGVNWTFSDTTGYIVPLAGTIEKTGSGTGTFQPTTSLAPTIGNIYKIVITFNSLSGSTLVATIGGHTLPTITTGTLTYTEYVVARNTNNLVFTPQGTALRFSIASITIKLVTAGNLTTDGLLTVPKLKVYGYSVFNQLVDFLSNITVVSVTASGVVGVTGAVTSGTRVEATVTSTTTTQLVGLLAQASAAALVGITERTSPYIGMEATAWNTTPIAASKANRMGIRVRGISGATTSGAMVFENITIDGVANTTELLRLSSSGKLGLLVAGVNSTKDFGLGGDTTRTIGLERNSVTNTAGSVLTINSGGAKSGATDTDAGMLVLTQDPSTGTGKASIKLQRQSRAATTGTTDNIRKDAIILPSEFNLTNSSVNSLFEIALPTLTGTGGEISFTIFATNGVDIQQYTGIVLYSAVNKAGTYSVSIVENISTKAISGGTLSTAWNILEGTNKITIQVTPVSSLTNTTYNIKYNILNHSGETLTQL